MVNISDLGHSLGEDMKVMFDVRALHMHAARSSDIGHSRGGEDLKGLFDVRARMGGDLERSEKKCQKS